MQGFVGPETYSFDHRAIVRADGGVLIRTLMAERKAWSQQQKIRIATERWLRELDPSSSYVLQVGANEHTKPKGVDFVDPVPLAIDLGWRAGLVEPVPYLVSKLRTHYQNAVQNRVQIVQGAVCRSCQQQDAKIWSVELDSNPATLGSNHSDPRCAQVRGAEFVTQIASLSRKQVLASDRNLAWGRHRCNLCSQLVGRPLPADCLRGLVRDHLVAHRVSCLCLESMVPRLLTEASRHAISLLMIDTEGHDLNVLQQYPFARVPTERVIYETLHLQDHEIVIAAKHMRSHGFVSLMAPLSRSRFSVWHRNHSVYRSTIPGPGGGGNSK